VSGEDRWERHEVEGSFMDAVAEVLLNEPPCSYVVITEGENPDAPGPKYIVLVPQWGIA